AVDLGEDLRGIRAPGGRRTQERGRHRHEERRRDALPGDVPDGEAEMAVVAREEEVVEVAAHLARRLDERLDVDLGATRTGWERLRQDAHLDVVGDAELALDALLLGDSVLELRGRAAKLGLHVAEGGGERSDLVALTEEAGIDLDHRTLDAGLGEAAG